MCAGSIILASVFMLASVHGTSTKRDVVASVRGTASDVGELGSAPLRVPVPESPDSM
jgi:hypothetical protein